MHIFSKHYVLLKYIFIIILFKFSQKKITNENLICSILVYV